MRWGVKPMALGEPQLRDIYVCLPFLSVASAPSLCFLSFNRRGRNERRCGIGTEYGFEYRRIGARIFQAIFLARAIRDIPGFECTPVASAPKSTRERHLPTYQTLRSSVVAKHIRSRPLPFQRPVNPLHLSEFHSTIIRFPFDASRFKILRPRAYSGRAAIIGVSRALKVGTYIHRCICTRRASNSRSRSRY